jgi:hypothetical protein
MFSETAINDSDAWFLNIVYRNPGDLNRTLIFDDIGYGMNKILEKELHMLQFFKNVHTDIGRCTNITANTV